jgi:Mg-chelatase subunit ChlD
MSFLVGAALAVGLLVVLPLVAHFLRRGRAAELPFPPAALVKATQTSARRERRLEDRALFSLRALAIATLAVLGATPLVRCSRLSFARGAGGSLAVAIVLDDSLSMRAAPRGKPSHFEQARDAAARLLDSTREGDSVAIVLAGAPPRVALAATSDLALARRTLKELAPSDRATDLAGAVALARSSFTTGAQREKRLVVLSDFAAPPPPAGDPPAWVPLPALAERLQNCGIASAERRTTSVSATLACTSADAARGRSLELSANGTLLGKLPVDARAGVQSVALPLPPEPAKPHAAAPPALTLHLDGEDTIAEDDTAPVAPDALALRVAVLADETEGGAVTGGAPLVEQVLTALERDITLRPLTVVPDQAADLENDALVLLDDPAGLGPEARAALSAFVEQGGAAVALLGPRAEARRIGATLAPFALGAVHWERAPKARGVDVASLGWLGPEARSLGDLKPQGRTLLDPGQAKGASVRATWSDGAPFIVERELGRGLVTTVTLPSSVEVSDFALRPGFVALVDHFIDVARRRRGLTTSVAGATWVFGSERPNIVGPDGPLHLVESPDRGRIATPSVRGAYRLTTEHGEELRTVTIDPEEITAEPTPPPTGTVNAGGAPSGQLLDVSAEVAYALLALLGLELLFRARRVDARPGFR